MDPKAIPDELTHAEGLPTAALRAASAQRNEMVPLFLHAIHRIELNRSRGKEEHK
jgi:hypothetical protein